MRLTLRTLLAYLDDILDPSDAEQLSAKIRESDFASGLVHRIRNTVGRLRLSAPPVIGRGLGADVNTVAEYLDNELPSERVPDFEKVCLESDVHLAEVAACHEILAIVLGEHATVEATLRERVYRLADASAVIPTNVADATYRRFEAAVASPPGTGESARKDAVESSRPTAADQGRSAVRRWWPLGIVAVAAVLATVAFWPRFRPQQIAQEIPSLMPTMRPPEPLVELPRPPSSPVGDDPVSPPVSPPSDRDGDRPEVIPVPRATRDVTPVEIDRRETNGEDDQTFAPVAAPKSMRPAAEEVVERADGIPSLDAKTSLVPKMPDAMADGATETTAVSALPITTSEAVPPPAAVAAAPAATTLQFEGTGQVLATWRPQEKSWWRIATDSDTTDWMTQRLYALPTFEPKMVVGNHLDVSGLGPAQWSIEKSERWHIDDGRFLISNLQLPADTLEVVLGSRTYALKCDAANTVALLDVRRVSPLGIDPQQASRRMWARLWVVAGAMSVDDDLVATGSRWSIVDNTPPEIITAFSEDVTGMAMVRDIDQQARFALEVQLDTNEPLEAALEAAYRDRRADVRSLAARCLAGTGRYEPLIETMLDPRYHSSWDVHFDLLRERVQSSPEEASRVREAVQQVAGPAAETLFRMLWGFSSQQLQDGAAERLVEALAHRDLSVRVLAGESLREITGSRHGYRADYHAHRRQDSIRRWKRRLEAGEIRYPEPMPNDL